MTTTFMDKFRSFFGIRQEPPRNEFRNPIWGSDDDDDVDELYTRDYMKPYNDPVDLHQEISEHMQNVFKSFGNMFGDMKVFFHENDHNMDSFTITDLPNESEDYKPNSLRDYYLKPGYHMKQKQPEDIDLDGKISSQDISGLLKQKEDDSTSLTPFNGNMAPGRSFCQTIITTSITKPDGTIETRKIIKNGGEVIEETITTTEPLGPQNSNLDNGPSGVIFNNLTDLMSLFRNFN